MLSTTSPITESGVGDIGLLNTIGAITCVDMKYVQIFWLLLDMGRLKFRLQGEVVNESCGGRKVIRRILSSRLKDCD